MGLDSEKLQNSPYSFCTAPLDDVIVNWKRSRIKVKLSDPPLVVINVFVIFKYKLGYETVFCIFHSVCCSPGWTLKKGN